MVNPERGHELEAKADKLADEVCLLACRDPSSNVLSQDRIPEPGQAKALALEAAKRSFQDRTHTVPPSTFSISDRTVRNVLHDKNYLGEGHPLMVPASIHHTKAHRVAEQKISRNMLAAAFALYQAYEHLPNSTLGSLDTTIINHPGTWSTRRGVVSWKKRTLYRSLNRNFVSVNTAHPDAVVHTNPFKSKLFCGMLASGQCLPFLLCLEAPGMAVNEFEFFELNGFHVNDNVPGWVVAVANMNKSVMKQVYKKYFLDILIPFIKAQPKSSDGESVFVLTMDGDQHQIGGLDEEVREEFRKLGVTVIKLPAATSAVLQPCDVSVCFRELKRLVHQMRYFGVLRPGTRASLKKIRLTLLGRHGCAWQKVFLDRLEYSVCAIAPALPLAFNYASIISTFDDMGWSPYNLRRILSRAQDTSEAVMTQCETAWPKLLLNCRSHILHSCQ